VLVILGWYLLGSFFSCFSLFSSLFLFHAIDHFNSRTVLASAKALTWQGVLLAYQVSNLLKTFMNLHMVRARRLLSSFLPVGFSLSFLPFFRSASVRMPHSFSTSIRAKPTHNELCLLALSL
jgi:hypothetical protein